MNYQTINVGNRIFKVVRIVKEDPKWDLEILRQFWHCSHTFKKEGSIYFCREIEDVELDYEELS
jgi:hypothetical protein